MSEDDRPPQRPSLPIVLAWIAVLVISALGWLILIYVVLRVRD